MLLLSKELPEIFEFEFPVFLRGKNRSNETPSVPSNTSQTSVREVAKRIPTLQYSLVLEVVEEHPASNGSVWEQEKRLVVVHLWDLHERRKVWIDRTLQSDPLANPGTWAPLVSMWWP